MTGLLRDDFVNEAGFLYVLILRPIDDRASSCAKTRHATPNFRFPSRGIEIGQEIQKRDRSPSHDDEMRCDLDIVSSPRNRNRQKINSPHVSVGNECMCGVDSAYSTQPTEARHPESVLVLLCEHRIVLETFFARLRSVKGA
jgi:hypothetical protein